MMWKEAATVYSEALPRNLPGGTEEIHENSQSEWPVSRPRFKLVTFRISLQVRNVNV